MKELFFTLIVLGFFIHTCWSQAINFELTSSVPQFQDADVGDMEFGDIDHDGDQDLIISGKGGPVQTTLYRNDGNGNFIAMMENVIEDVYRSKIGLNDVDRDGDLDLLISGTNSQPVASSNLYLNDGSGNFILSANAAFAAVEDGDIAFGDIDGDGDDDVIMVGSNSSASPITKVYRNDGAGIFLEVMSTNLAAIQYGAVELFDCDMDNDLDVILAGENADGNNFTGLFLNDGSGVFIQVTNTAFNHFVGGDIAIGDTDLDGDLDVLLCGNKTQSDIETELYLNDGTGTFSLWPNTIFSDVSLGEASFNDFDNDGDLDVFVLGTGEGGLATNSIVGNVYENLGSNQFVLADSLIGGYLSSHAVADIDGDQDLDLILGGTTIGSPIRATWMYKNQTIISSTDELIQTSNVEIYPNPSQGMLQVRFETQTKAMIKVYSQLGHLVYSNQIQSELNSIKLDLRGGIYFFVLETQEVLISKKLIIQD
jgi:hypothetical protein